MSYIMDIRVQVLNLPKKIKQNLTLQAHIVTVFHHNYGSKDDITYKISEIVQSNTVNSSHKHVGFSFLLHFPSIGVSK